MATMNKSKRINQIFADSELSSTTKLVYLYIIRHMSESDRVRIDIDKVVDTLYLSKTTFGEALKNLSKHGYITYTYMFHDENGEEKKDITFL